MKKLIQITLVSISTILFVLFSTGCPNETSEVDKTNRASELPQRDAKIYCNVTIEDDFDDSSLIVILDNLTGEVNKKHDERFFFGI